ncbi:hypothetical protein [Winogradskya humida]|uniref:Uncharacterized protein n=1 Tax=Winogradskya humida TaxID=113566 RepID=A0ABQ4A739_9ACTN|nr:hypothetical protein [Actinoplanes humidus]GIE26681.1 hypothetical protein Ahu01nite_097830 [Actinoplanes humidus]
MGWIKDAKAEALAKEARKAIEDGRRVHVVRINVGMTQQQLSGSLAGFAEQIEAVEDAGWVMHDMSFGNDKQGKPEGYFLFRLPR